MEKIPEKIEPTGTCFDDAFHLFCVFLPNKNMPPVLVHGICVKENGDKFAHAWVERGDEAYFSGLVRGKKFGFSTSILEFYKKFGVLEHSKYDAEYIRDLLEKDLGAKVGPWEQKYLELCSDRIDANGREE
jgi:hypothetical protein